MNINRGTLQLLKYLAISLNIGHRTRLYLHIFRNLVWNMASINGPICIIFLPSVLQGTSLSKTKWSLLAIICALESRNGKLKVQTCIYSFILWLPRDHFWLVCFISETNLKGHFNLLINSDNYRYQTSYSLVIFESVPLNSKVFHTNVSLWE